MSIVMLVFFGVIFFQLTTGTQVIGGGYNTESDVEAETALRLVRLAFASSSKRSGRNVLEEKLDLNLAPEIQKVKSSLSSSRKRTRRDPTHRNRNDAFNCHLLSMMLGELSPFLNLTQFVGLARQLESYPSLPDNQPSVDDCPSGYGSWWPRSEMNLRKIQQAVCICETCIAADSMNCEEIRQNMTVFSIRGCPDGVAIYNKLDLSIVVGCHCANAAISQVRITEA
ncbi:hypothetical protein BgiBS90_016199 [Biomphalaria glabrata]|nr:hypothetical protein BgiBS90_016199 [Biomphalaria glabrata]